MGTVPTVSVGEAEACSVALEGTSVREPLRHPAVTLGNLDGTCESGLLSQDLSALNSVWRFPHWGDGDNLESLGNPQTPNVEGH